ncbi:MAG: TlpA family protein disulfide reductase [Methylococcaceae bacterium]
MSKATESDFNAFVKGSFSQIQQQYKNTPHIVVFWSETCAFCMKELAIFGRLIPQFPQVKLITISTDPFLDDNTVQQILSSKKLEGTETWVFADDFAERLYFDVSPRWRGELPLTYFFDRNNTMLKHMGIVKEAELVEWLNDQSLDITAVDK